jgi:hypothetical protein
MSGDARIGRIWLNSGSQVSSAITIDGAFTGSDTIAIIDVLISGANIPAVDKQILKVKGSGALSSYNRFTLGVARAANHANGGAGTALSGYHIDSDGYLRQDQ